jgi:Collagen triple helix repeat (20 copies)
VHIHKYIAVGTVCAVLGGGGIATAATGLMSGSSIKPGSIPTNRLDSSAQQAIARASHYTTGPAGPVGPKGDTGAAGAAGPQGPKGDTGAVGPAGAKGDSGAAGPKGDTGADGAQGAQGAQGAAGPVGPVGQAGPQGADGESAYQAWLDQGNTGTQADFTASLTGPQGPQGDKGDTGDTGAVGPTGPQGPQGATGATGAAGPQGPAGVANYRGGEWGFSTGQSSTLITFSSPMANNSYTVNVSWTDTGTVPDLPTGTLAVVQNKTTNGFNVALFSPTGSSVSALGSSAFDWTAMPTK